MEFVLEPAIFAEAKSTDSRATELKGGRPVVLAVAPQGEQRGSIDGLSRTQLTLFYQTWVFLGDPSLPCFRLGV